VPPIPISEAVKKISEITEIPESSIRSIFKSASNGETFLLLNDFPNIQKELNLPQNITARQLSEQIINS
jgi:2-oxo-4-hydroxy-4-carboxy--5-ureidoimidazoline (OHCU) decarboxylase